jgi:hypothetical protein
MNLLVIQKVIRPSFCVAGSLLWMCFAACNQGPDMRGWQNLDRSYEEKIINWTRSGIVYQSLDRVLSVHAIYFSNEMRKAYASQYHTVFGIDPDKVDSDLEMMATFAGKGHEFFVFADTNEFSWNNLDERESVWRLFLGGGDGRVGVSPSSIQRFSGRGPNMRAFFPFVNEFGRAYLVVFPLEQTDGKPLLENALGQITLRISSAFGTAQMSWQVSR